MKKDFKEKLFFIMDSISAYVTYIDAKTLRYQFVNEKFAQAYNLPREQIIGRHMSEILPEKNFQHAASYVEAVRNGKAVTYEQYFSVPIGKRWVKVDYIPEIDAKGDVKSFIVLGTDITDRKIAEEKLKKSEALYRFIVETANEGILTLDLTLNIVFTNNKLASMLGYETEELLGMSVEKIAFDERLKNLEEHLKKSTQGESIIYEAYLKRKDGAKHWVLVSGKAMIDETGCCTGFFIMFTDIHARKMMEEQLENAVKKLEVLSNQDGLTKLANRRYFDEISQAEYNRLSRYEASLSFIMIDIDYFKDFNDYYGHLAGDVCLQQVANMLAGSVSYAADLIARYGGEEFICMLPDTDRDGALMVAEKMRAGVESLCIRHNGSKISDYVTISLGVVSVKCLPGQDMFVYIGHADKALYQAKANGRNRIEYYN